MDELTGKVAVITGGASGIGRALADRFGAEGMALVLADVEAPALEAAAAELREAGRTVTTVVADVSRLEDVERIRDEALAAHGAVHVVCNNAGVGGGGLMAQSTAADWDWVLGVNLFGVIHGVRTFLPLLLEQGEGHIVNTASVAGLFAAPFMGPYNASKFAVVALSETLFHELAMTGTDVGVSVLCPAWVATRIAEADRNRPADLRNDVGGDGDGDVLAERSPMQEMLNTFIQTGMAPAEVADRVHDAVVGRQFYVLTHDTSLAAIEARMTAILSGGDPPMAMPG